MKWKDKLVIGSSPEMVKNPYSGESCELSPEQIAIYDLIKGSEVLIKAGATEGSILINFNQALKYFREQWPKEYLILLD
jgi:hypothetical protein